MSASRKVYNNFIHHEEHKSGNKVPVYRQQVVYLNKEQAELEKQSRQVQRGMGNAKGNR